MAFLNVRDKTGNLIPVPAIPGPPGDDYVLTDADKAEIAAAAAQLVDYIPTPTTAEVGQTIVVSAVDEDGKPTMWEAADLPGGGGGSLGTLLKDITLQEDATLSITDFDTSLNEYHVLIWLPAGFSAATNVKLFGTIGADYYLEVDASSSAVVLCLNYNIFADGYFHMERNTYTKSSMTAEIPTWPDSLNNAHIRSGIFGFTDRTKGLASSATFPEGTRIMIWGR